MVSSGVTVASEAITDSFARTIVPTVTSTGRGSRGTSVGTVALIMAWRRCASPMLSAMFSVSPSARKAGACHSALRVMTRPTSGAGGAGGATVKARDGLGPGGAAELRGVNVSVWLGAIGVLGLAASRDEAQDESESAASAVASSAMTPVVRIATI